jgi:hypothetical protein
MSSASPEVRMLLSVLTEKLNDSSAIMDSQAIGNALYGIQSMSSDAPEVRALLIALTAKVKDTKEVLSPQHISNSLYGLQFMGSEHPEVRGLLRVLTVKMRECSERFTPHAIGNVLYGLQSMSSEVVAVEALLTALTAKMRDIAEPFSAQSISAALYGLGGLTSGILEDACSSNTVITTPASSGVAQQLDASVNSKSYYLIPTNEATRSFSALLERVFAELDRAIAAPGAFSLSSFDKRDLMRNLKFFNRDSMQGRISLLSASLPKHGEAGYRDGSLQGSSRAEREFCKVIEKLLASSSRDKKPECGDSCSITVKSNVYLDGCFEADIVITRVSPEGGDEDEDEDEDEDDEIEEKEKEEEEEEKEKEEEEEFMKFGKEEGEEEEMKFAEEGEVMEVQIEINETKLDGRSESENENKTESGSKSGSKNKNKTESGSKTESKTENKTKNKTESGSKNKNENENKSKNKSGVFNIEIDGPSHSLPAKQRLSLHRDQHLQEACGVKIARISLLKPTGEWLQSEEYEEVAREVLQLWELLPPSRLREE